MALIDSLSQTQLDRNNGATPRKYNGVSKLTNSLSKSQLDRNDGATPSKYLDNPPG